MVEGEKINPELTKNFEVKVFYTSGVSYITSKQTVRSSWHHEEEVYEVRQEYGAWGIAVIDNLPFFYVAYNVGGVHDNWSVYKPVHPVKFTPPSNSGEVRIEHRQRVLKMLGVKVEKNPEAFINQYRAVFESEENIAKYVELFEIYNKDPELRAKFGHKVREALDYKQIDPK